MIAAQHRARGTLLATSALHVGSGTSDTIADLPVVRDGRGRPMIPGTSLAGALRAHLLDADHSEAVAMWLGGFSSDRTVSIPSALAIDDAPVSGGTYAADGLDVFTTTRIDPVTGVAATTGLFSRQTIPAGTIFAFSMELEVTDGDDGLAFLGVVLAVLRAGITVGASTTRGFGAIRLTDVEQQTVPLDTRAGFLRHLTGPQYVPIDDDDHRATQRPISAHTVSVHVPFTPAGPIMSSVEVDGAVNRVPLTVATSPGKVRLLLAGSGTKGALRARAIYILGALGAKDPESDPAFQLLFGVPSTAQSRQKGSTRTGYGVSTQHGGEEEGLPAGPADQSAALLGRGRLRVHNSTSHTELSRTLWEKICNPDEGQGTREDRRRRRRSNLAEAIRVISAGADSYVIADRVAIDRWTGGAANQRLYSLLEPHTDWTPLQVDLNLYGVGSALAQRSIGLLCLILRGLIDGWIPLGYGTRRGLGQIAITASDVTVTAGSKLTAWPDLAAATFADVLRSERIAAAVAATTDEYPARAGAANDV